MKVLTRVGICKHHHPKKMGYLAHQAWMEKMHKAGARQRQCAICGRWLYPCEE